MNKSIVEFLKANKELDIITIKHLTINKCDEVWFQNAIRKFKLKHPNYPSIEL